MICLDTNYLIHALVAGTPEAAQVALWLRQKTPLAMSAVAWYEFCCGPLSPKDHRMAQVILTGGVLPFGPEQAAEAARLFNGVGRRRPLRVDAMIAATALVAKASLATDNTDDFRPFEALGLRLEG
ncbi:MAG: PIN domain-containing protein [Spirochaetales bacterium]